MTAHGDCRHWKDWKVKESNLPVFGWYGKASDYFISQILSLQEIMWRVMRGPHKLILINDSNGFMNLPYILKIIPLPIIIILPSTLQIWNMEVVQTFAHVNLFISTPCLKYAANYRRRLPGVDSLESGADWPFVRVIPAFVQAEWKRIPAKKSSLMQGLNPWIPRDRRVFNPLSHRDLLKVLLSGMTDMENRQ
jgi:hypothetical protein